MNPYKLLFPVAAGLIDTSERYLKAASGYALYRYSDGYSTAHGSGYVPNVTEAMNMPGALWAGLLTVDLPVAAYRRALKAADYAAFDTYRQRMRDMHHADARALFLSLSAPLHRRQRIAGYMIGLMPRERGYDAAGALTRACTALGCNAGATVAMAGYLDDLAMPRYGGLYRSLAYMPLIDVLITALKDGGK